MEILHSYDLWEIEKIGQSTQEDSQGEGLSVLAGTIRSDIPTLGKYSFLAMAESRSDAVLPLATW